MAVTDNHLDAVIDALPPAPGGYVVAFSGGLDSTALLHRLHRCEVVRPLRAVHVQHDLHPDAPAWAGHCRDLCAAWGVPLSGHAVAVARDAGEGIEAAARRARYAALRSDLEPGEVLVTAHHAEDQAETFLLQALRGGGIRGLAAMPAVAGFGAGRHARPMLTIERQAIRDYARANGLDWIEDPGNADPAIDRSYLRTRVWPPIARRWPGAAAALGRAAAWCAEAADLHREWAALDLASCAGAAPDRLAIPPLSELGAARRRNLLRHWLDTLGLPMPGHRHMAEIDAACLASAADAEPCVTWPGAELRRYGGQLYAMAPLPPVPREWSSDWAPDTRLTLPAGGSLQAERAPGGLKPGESYRVCLRRGGERVRLPGRDHDTALKTALQDAGVPPWARERLPLVYARGRIAAVADLWVCDDFAAAPGGTGWHPRWRDPPPGWPPAGDR